MRIYAAIILTLTLVGTAAANDEKDKGAKKEPRLRLIDSSKVVAKPDKKQSDNAPMLKIARLTQKIVSALPPDKVQKMNSDLQSAMSLSHVYELVGQNGAQGSMLDIVGEDPKLQEALSNMLFIGSLFLEPAKKVLKEQNRKHRAKSKSRHNEHVTKIVRKDPLDQRVSGFHDLANEFLVSLEVMRDFEFTARYPGVKVGGLNEPFFRRRTDPAEKRHAKRVFREINLLAGTARAHRSFLALAQSTSSRFDQLSWIQQMQVAIAAADSDPTLLEGKLTGMDKRVLTRRLDTLVTNGLKDLKADRKAQRMAKRFGGLLKVRELKRNEYFLRDPVGGHCIPRSLVRKGGKIRWSN